MNRTLPPAWPVPSLLFALASTFAATASADVIDANGYAIDLAADVTIAGTFTPVGGPDVTVDETLHAGPLTQAAAASPPFDQTVSPSLVSQEFSVSLHETPALTATGGIDPYLGILGPPSLHTISDVDGGPGPWTTASTASSFGGMISVRIGTSGIVSVLQLPTGDSPPPVATASVTSDGVTLETDTSFLPFSSLPLTLTVLGTSLGVPVDFPNGISTVTIPVNVLSVLGTAAGSVTLTADSVSTYNDGITASVTATTLLVEFDLNVDIIEPGVGSYVGDVGGTMAFNSAHASMTLAPVPEPAGAALLLTGSLLTAARRRRPALRTGGDPFLTGPVGANSAAL